MPTLRARYHSTCPVCTFAIEPGQTIVYDPRNGVPAQHEDCQALKRQAVDEAERMIRRGAQIAAWQDRNPMPVLERIAGAAGAPRIDLEFADTDEERRCALAAYQAELDAWMQAHPEVRQEFEKQTAAWEARRAEFIRRLDAPSVSRTEQSHVAPAAGPTQRARTR